MISIKKFLSSEHEAGALIHVVRSLIRGIGDHAVGDPEDCAQFRRRIDHISETLQDEFTAEDLLLHAGSVLNALEEHNRRAAAQQTLQTSELQNMVRMLTSAVGAISAASEINVGRLSEIEKQVVSASQLDDVRAIKTRLSDCLADIRTEAERQRNKTNETVARLGEQLDRVRQSSAGAMDPSARDPLTGFPIRPGAETALAEAIQGRAPAFAVVFVLDRLQALNLRFGKEVGDQVMREFARMIRKNLHAEDQVFRWSGPSMVALLARPGGIESVRAEIARLVETKVEHTIETASRTILIPIAARWAVFPMMASPRLLYQRIDTFAVLAPHD